MSDVELEKAILFYIIFQNEDYDLSEKDFIEYKNKLLIKTITELKAKKENISMLAINEKLQDAEILKYMAHLGDLITTESAETIFFKLKEYTKRRQIFDLLKENQIKLQNVDNIDIFIEKIISEMQKIEFQTQKDESFISQVVQTAEEIEKNINKKEDLSLYTGYFDLDDLTDGLHNGELTIIGARPRGRKNHFFFTISRKYC